MITICVTSSKKIYRNKKILKRSIKLTLARSVNNKEILDQSKSWRPVGIPNEMSKM